MLAATRIPRALAALAEGPTALYTRGDAVATAHPVLFGMVCAGLKTVAADLTVQTVVEKKQLHEVDKRRTITFGLFGIGYLGGIQYAVFNKVLPAMWPRASNFAMRSSHDKINNAKALRSLVGLVATEQLIHTPFVFLPCFYMTKEVVEGDGNVDVALTKWRRNIIPDMCADMVIWVPSNLVNFAFVPQHFRVPFVALTSFAYTMVLSFMRGGQKRDVVVEEPVVLEEAPVIEPLAAVACVAATP